VPARLSRPFLVAGGVSVVAALAVVAAGSRVAYVIGALAGAGLVAVVARYPQRAVLVLVTLLPFDQYAMAALYRLGMPAAALRALRYWPEAVLAGLALVALWVWQRSSRRVDALDWAVLAYVGLGTAYLLAPGFFVGNAAGADLSLATRGLGWHTDVMYIAVVAIARRIPFSADQKAALVRRVVLVGVVLALLGLFEFVQPASWNHLATAVLQVPTYQAEVLGALPGNTSLNSVVLYVVLGGHKVARVGSVLDYETLGFYLAICLGLMAEWLVRRRGGRWGPPAFLVLALGLLVTQTRSALIAGAVAVAMAFRPRPGRVRAERRRLGRALLVVVAAAAVLILFGHVGARLGGDAASDSAHLSSGEAGLKVILDNPFGRGLATAAGAGQTAATEGQAHNIVVAENQLLQIAMQLGFVGLALFALVLGLLIARTERLSSPFAAAAENSLAGLLIGGLFLQPFITDPVSITMFVLLAVAVPGPGCALSSGPDGSQSLHGFPGRLPPPEIAARGHHRGGRIGRRMGDCA
jgi:uncharacterized protein YjeT (DUF2065 family)